MLKENEKEKESPNLKNDMNLDMKVIKYKFPKDMEVYSLISSASKVKESFLKVKAGKGYKSKIIKGELLSARI
jgi:hypothetical protein